LHPSHYLEKNYRYFVRGVQESRQRRLNVQDVQKVQKVQKVQPADGNKKRHRAIDTNLIFLFGYDTLETIKWLIQKEFRQARQTLEHGTKLAVKSDTSLSLKEVE
jgi:hypothetical protein